jgi:hypothetical protein
MNDRARKVLEEALSLPEEDRAFVVAELQESLGPDATDEVRAAWDDELVRRAQPIEDHQSCKRQAAYASAA